jgi:hypothetical protein
MRARSTKCCAFAFRTLRRKQPLPVRTDVQPQGEIRYTERRDATWRAIKLFGPYSLPLMMAIGFGG